MGQTKQGNRKMPCEVEGSIISKALGTLGMNAGEFHPAGRRGQQGRLARSPAGLQALYLRLCPLAS